MAIPFCRPKRTKDMKPKHFGHFFYSTGAFLSASVDPPFKESTDSGLMRILMSLADPLGGLNT